MDSEKRDRLHQEICRVVESIQDEDLFILARIALCWLCVSARPIQAQELWLALLIQQTHSAKGSDQLDVFINNKGVVMGCVGPHGMDGCGWGDGRAFQWRDGVLQDLTDLVRAKGAALPTGAVLTEVLALNDAGSFVARMKTPGASDSFVRLIARP